MYKKRITLAEIKQEIKDLKKSNTRLRHTQALNEVAQKYGYEKFEILKAKYDTNEYIEFDCDISEVLQYCRSTSIASYVTLSSLPLKG